MSFDFTAPAAMPLMIYRSSTTPITINGRIAAKDSAEPDADIFTELHVTDDLRTGRDPVSPGGRQFGGLVSQTVDRHLSTGLVSAGA